MSGPPDGVERRKTADRRRPSITPGLAIVYIIVVAAATVGFFKVGSLTADVRAGAKKTCELQQQTAKATLDLGAIIEAARAQTSTDPRIPKAAHDYLLQVKRLPKTEPTARALRDLAVLVGASGSAPQPPHDSGPNVAEAPKLDINELARREDDFIKLTKTLKKPRDCDKEFTA